MADRYQTCQKFWSWSLVFGLGSIGFVADFHFICQHAWALQVSPALTWENEAICLQCYVSLVVAWADTGYSFTTSAIRFLDAWSVIWSGVLLILCSQVHTWWHEQIEQAKLLIMWVNMLKVHPFYSVWKNWQFTLGGQQFHTWDEFSLFVSWVFW